MKPTGLRAMLANLNDAEYKLLERYISDNFIPKPKIKRQTLYTCTNQACSKLHTKSELATLKMEAGL